MQNALPEQIARLASAPILLAACDFDGTLAPIAPTPDAAQADERALKALEALAHMESTHAAIISGRARDSLAAKTAAARGITLIGGHGAELPGFAPSDVDRAALGALQARMAEIAARHAGALAEPKPTGVAVHYRQADPALHNLIREEVRAEAQRLGCPLVREGILVVEAGVVATNKGRALKWLTERVNAHAVLFAGDDSTDEDAFAVLRPQDVGVKVGAGDTAADQRSPDHEAVRAMLESLVDARAAWLKQRRLTSIDDLGFLSDQRTGALVDSGGRVVWMCAPRFDAAPVFAHLLGGAAAGFFEISSADGHPPLRRGYEPGTFILRTEYDGFTVSDYLDCSGGRAFQRAGRSDLVRVVEGRGRIVIRFAPRIDFGRSPTRLISTDLGLRVEGSIDPSILYAPGVQWTIQDDGPNHLAVATVELPDRPLLLELRLGSSGMRDGRTPEKARRETTARFWTGWASTLLLPARHTELVRRSALAIKALCYGPTGAICAAGTCSLPEQLGGVRNWDYRFCWIRDAAMSAAALVRLGSTGHGLKFLDWLGGILEDMHSPEHLRPIYTVRGAELGPEGEVSEAAGYGDSRPVRVGNGAAHQVQLDVFGAVADLISLLAEQGAPLTPEHWGMLDAMVRAVDARWREPDHGIWEIRGPLLHHVHSKTMCWFTVARAIQARELTGEPVRDMDRALAALIREDVLTHGYKQDVGGGGAFTAAHGHWGTDAASLLVGLTGLIAPDDERFASTIRVVERDLLENGSVLRYRYEDGLPGVEGGFHLCTGWLIESLHMVGRKEEAAALLDQYAAQAGPLGLYAEERCTVTGRALGNYPQAYSHLALINACVRLSS